VTTPYGVLLPDGCDADQFARRAADLGYERLWLGELWGEDAFVRLTRAADAPIGLGTAVVNVFSRTPATLAQAAATVDEAAGDDRFVLGLGTSTATAIESLHGESFDRPVRRLHETAELAGRLLGDAEAVDYDGETVGASGAPGLDVDVPVYAAALGPAARRAVGRVADGWLPHNVPFDRLEPAFDTVAETARERGRSPDDVAVVPWVPCAVADDEGVARDAVRDHLAYYVGSGEGYRNAVAESFPDAAEAIASAWERGDRDEASQRVTDEMVAAIGVAGTPETAPDRLDAVLDRDVVDAAVLVLAGGAKPLLDSTVDSLAPDR